MPPVQGASWEEWLRWFLCEMYKQTGGDCKDLFGDDAQRVVTVVEHFDTIGVPQFATPADKAAFVDILKALQAHLDLPGNSLPAASDEELRDLITKLLGELD